MIPKRWWQEDYLCIGFTRGAIIFIVFMLLTILTISHTIAYWVGKGIATRTFNKLYWTYCYKLEYIKFKLKERKWKHGKNY